MANEIQVTTTELIAKAGELRQFNQELNQKIEELETTENTLNGMWDGEANETFHQAFTRDAIQMRNFYNAIEKYVQVLEEVANKYQQAERKNMSIASHRSY